VPQGGPADWLPHQRGGRWLAEAKKVAKGSRREKRRADVIGNSIKIARIAKAEEDARGKSGAPWANMLDVKMRSELAKTTC
jgi:hypothetical protein